MEGRIRKWLLISVFIFSSSYALERAGEVLQELERPIKKPQIPQKPQIFIEEKKTKKKVTNNIKFFVRKIKIQGAKSIPIEELSEIVKKYEGKNLSLVDLQKLADEITQLYRKKGFVTSFAYIPTQTIKEGIVVIKVVESKLGNINVQGNKRYPITFFQKHFTDLQGKPLNIHDLQQKILILNEYPFLRLSSFLKAGKQPFSSDLFLKAEEERPLKVYIHFNNWGSKLTSKNRILFNVQTGFLIKHGDLLDLKFLTGLDRIDVDRLRYIRAEYSLPVNFSGTRTGIYYTNSAYQAGQEFKILGLEGKADVLGIFITHPLILKKDKDLRIKAEFTYKDVYEYILDSRRSKDAIRSLSFGVSYGFLDSLNGYNYWEFSITQGFKGIFGGSGDYNPQASRFGAQGDFTKFNFSLMRIQALPYGVTLHGIIQGQWSDDKLFSAEQFILGGVGSVRGFEPAEVSGDKGLNASVELEAPIVPSKYLQKSLFKRLSLALFWDWGGVFRNNPIPGEYGNRYLMSIGTGLRARTQRLFSLNVDIAIPHKNDEFATGSSMVYVSADLKF